MSFKPSRQPSHAVPAGKWQVASGKRQTEAGLMDGCMDGGRVSGVEWRQGQTDWWISFFSWPAGGGPTFLVTGDCAGGCWFDWQLAQTGPSCGEKNSSLHI